MCGLRGAIPVPKAGDTGASGSNDCFALPDPVGGTINWGRVLVAVRCHGRA